MGQRIATNVRTVSSATVDENKIAGSTVAELTVHGPNDATVINSVKPEII